MTVTKKATVKVQTAELRHALHAVYAHHNPRKKDDAIATHRIRLTFALGYLFITAANDTSCALAKVPYLADSDSRGDLWEPDDGPIVVDLQPRHAKLITRQFAAKAADSAVDQLLAIDIDVEAGEIGFTDIGGLWTEGESLGLLFTEPSDQFPDIIDVVGRALAGVAGAGERGKALVQDGRVLAKFRDAAIQYAAALHIRPTGTGESRGFVVQCGPNFIGTVSSQHGDDEGTTKRDKWDQAWLMLLRPGQLQSA